MPTRVYCTCADYQSDINRQTNKIMVNECPNIKDDSRYWGVDAAKLLGIHPNTLRAHANRGLIKATTNPRSLRRIYTGKAIKVYWRQYN